ncbi:unnamed protein product [Fasciola hepatica]|uniref:Uncharacterized protein n=1 Tax=Fasciola hepatica TaxID=6192 RepID=A0ABC9HFM9_FASHE
MTPVNYNIPPISGKNSGGYSQIIYYATLLNSLFFFRNVQKYARGSASKAGMYLKVGKPESYSESPSQCTRERKSRGKTRVGSRITILSKQEGRQKLRR